MSINFTIFTAEHLLAHFISFRLCLSDMLHRHMRTSFAQEPDYARNGRKKLTPALH